MYSHRLVLCIVLLVVFGDVVEEDLDDLGAAGPGGPASDPTITI